MFEGVMGYGRGSGLLQVVVPVEVGCILSRVPVWKNTRQTYFSFSKTPLLQHLVFLALVSRSGSQSVGLTRLQQLLTHAGAPSKAEATGALGRNRGGGLLSGERMIDRWSKNSDPHIRKYCFQ